MRRSVLVVVVVGDLDAVLELDAVEYVGDEVVAVIKSTEVLIGKK